jgi:Mrp family chromosome partitioning ATPase/capsular polysaccharide biosynthesis protein
VFGASLYSLDPDYAGPEDRDSAATDGSLTAMNETTDATAIFAPLWRRKWLILAVGLIVGAASYFYYKNATRVYQSTTSIYLGAGQEEQGSGGRSNSKGQGVEASNQVSIINSIVIEKVRQAVRKKDPQLVRGATIRAKSPEKSEFIQITTEAHTAKGAALLANATASAYIKRQNANRQAAIEREIAIARRQLHRIEAANAPTPVVKPAENGTEKGKTTPAPVRTQSSSSILQAASLNSKINQLETTLGVSGAQQVKRAQPDGAVLLAPKPRKNAIFGFVIGIVLAAIAAFVLGRVDRRLRSLGAIESVFHAQILSGLPKVKHPIVRHDGQPSPSRFLVEPLRRLHTSLQLGLTGDPERLRPSRMVLFASADPGDGKSTLVADLALVQREAGERVAIVEANFRRPALTRMLGLDAAHGLADVLTGKLAVEQAMQRVHPIVPAELAEQPVAAAPVATVAPSSELGSLCLLAGGSAANPPALLGHPAMAELLRSLADDFDYVLIDAPSPLEVSDVVPLLKLVDGVVTVARVGHTRELAAQRLVQMLAQAGAPVLGTVANCVPRKEIERYGFSSANGRLWSGRLTGR